MSIDWVFISQELFKGSITLIIAVFSAFVAFKFGKKRSDADWKRKTELEKEKLLQEREEEKRQLLLIMREQLLEGINAKAQKSLFGSLKIH
jgi:hypothetical protein